MPRQIVLTSRPVRCGTAANFAVAEADRPDLADGQVRVRNVSVGGPVHARPDERREVLRPPSGWASRWRAPRSAWSSSPARGPGQGDLVLHMLGWRDEAVCRPAGQEGDRREGPVPSVYLGVLGMPALAAYVGLLDIAALKPGDLVFVSAGRRGGQHGRPDRQAQGRPAGDRQRGQRREAPLAARDRI